MDFKQFATSLQSGAPVVLPVGGDFVSTGLIGLWQAGFWYEFGAQADSASVVEALGSADIPVAKPGQPGALYIVRESSGWVWLRASDYDKAGKAIEVLDIRNQRGDLQRPAQIWHLEASLASILIPDKNKANFNNPVSYDIRVMSLRSDKHRHELHLLALPSAVAAYAKARGWLTPGFDTSELLNRDRIFDDEFQASMIGGEFAGNKVAYSKSILWQRRAAVWAALGESEADKFNPIGTGSKADTTSERLSEALSVLAKTWPGPTWCRVIAVPNPKVDEVYTDQAGESKRRGVACITEFFADEAEARKAAEAERGQTSETESAPVSTTAASAAAGLKVPAVYAAYPQLWNDAIASLRAKTGTLSGPPAIRLAAISQAVQGDANFTGIASEEILPWVS